MKKLTIVFQLLLTGMVLFAQPEPGDLFKEYRWYNASGDCRGALRVGGNLDYRLSGTVDNYKGNGMILPSFDLDLEQSIRAELVIEKMLCHGGTEGLRVSINGNTPIPIPAPQEIPNPRSAYAYHFNAVVPVGMEDLRQGQGNSFQFEVDTAGHWWPQNLLYGMSLRIYYEPALLDQRGEIVHPASGDTLGLVNQIRLELPADTPVEKIDLVGFYDGPDMEGDGIYRKWHYAYHKCQIYNHLTTLSASPYEHQWNTEWIPDQSEKVKLAAFIHRSDGYIYMSEALEELVLERPGHAVELCKPYRRPKGWFTRKGEFSEHFQIKGKLEQMEEAKMIFRTWSPGYFNGIYINDFIVLVKEGPKYAYFEHAIPLEGYTLKQGENILKTGKTPLYPEGMVHGAEVQWPGIMLLIKYNTDK